MANIMDLFGAEALKRLLAPSQGQGLNMLQRPQFDAGRFGGNMLQGAPEIYSQPSDFPDAPLPALPSSNVASAPAVMPMQQQPTQQPAPQPQMAQAPQPAQAIPQQAQQAQGMGNPLSGLGDFFTPDRKATLNDFFTGLAMGQDWQSGLALGAANVNQNKSSRQQRNQTVDFLKGKGLSDEEASQVASNPAVLSDFLKGVYAQKEAPKPIEVNGRLVDPTTYKVIADFSDPQKQEDKDTALIRELKAAGLKEGTPEFQEAILANNRPKGMMIESDGQGGFKMVQGTDVSGGANMNVEQGKNTGFLLRAQDADKVITSLESEGTSVWNNTAGQLPGVGNFLRGDNAQKFDQAKRDFINAQLRQESGAVISPEEFKNAEVQYFPQPGDSQAVIEQKRANRQNAISGFRIRSGPGAQSVDKMNAAPASSIDDLVKKYGG